MRVWETVKEQEGGGEEEEEKRRRVYSRNSVKSVTIGKKGTKKKQRRAERDETGEGKWEANRQVTVEMRMV